MSTSEYIHQVVAGTPGGPLLFTFHGTGADETQFLGLGKQLMPGATIIAPRGDVSEYGAARYFRRTGEGVYDMDDLARATEKMARFIEAHRAEHGASQVVGLGYSNGANILASVIFANPGLFDAAVLMHPLIPFEPKVDGDLGATRVLITAGRRDPICPPALTEQLEKSLITNGAAVETVWHDGGHEVRPVELEATQRFLASATNGASA
jgi:phospholipase/carboxylesterase